MKEFEITYHLSPFPDVKVRIIAQDEEQAIIFAKEYRNDAFSVEELKADWSINE